MFYLKTPICLPTFALFLSIQNDEWPIIESTIIMIILDILIGHGVGLLWFNKMIIFHKHIQCSIFIIMILSACTMYGITELEIEKIEENPKRLFIHSTSLSRCLIFSSAQLFTRLQLLFCALSSTSLSKSSYSSFIRLFESNSSKKHGFITHFFFCSVICRLYV